MPDAATCRLWQGGYRQSSCKSHAIVSTPDGCRNSGELHRAAVWPPIPGSRHTLVRWLAESWISTHCLPSRQRRQQPRRFANPRQIRLTESGCNPGLYSFVQLWYGRQGGPERLKPGGRLRHFKRRLQSPQPLAGEAPKLILEWINGLIAT